jgi:ribosomal-protein-alanine N-acetyltransferase
MPSSPQPTLETERLTLRPFVEADAGDVERLAGAREIAEGTLAIPHPYPKGGGAMWIGTHADGWASGKQANFAIVERATGALVGAIGVVVVPEHAHAELGYWIGVESWNRGYATEAARATLTFAFESLGLHRIEARHFMRNPASGRVMQKIGMRLEGVNRGAVRRFGRFEDLAVYGILATDRTVS